LKFENHQKLFFLNLKKKNEKNEKKKNLPNLLWSLAIEYSTFPNMHNQERGRGIIMSQPHFESKCEEETHTPKSENLESSGTPTTLKLDSKGKNTLP
jgi:hypothetical protein